MDSIDKAILFAETNDRPGYKKPLEEDEPVAIYEAIDQLRKTPKSFLDWWISAKEFQRAKLQRSNTIPTSSGDDALKSVNISFVGNNRDSGIQEDS